jgi:prepilin-type N-terminal cleavage/methylation domain-containing protein
MNTNRSAASLFGDRRGFTLTEVLIAAMILLIALLSLASMFPMGYRQIADAGRMTMAVSAARQVLEDAGTLPFANVINLNGVDTSSNTGVIAALTGPEAAVARRWRYMLAGSGNGFAFTSAETTAWGNVQPYAARAVVSVTAPGGSTTLNQVTVTVTIPGLPSSVTLSTMIVRLF